MDYDNPNHPKIIIGNFIFTTFRQRRNANAEANFPSPTHTYDTLYIQKKNYTPPSPRPPLKKVRSYMNYGKKASTISALRTDTIILYLHFILFCWTTEIKQKFCNEFISHIIGTVSQIERVLSTENQKVLLINIGGNSIYVLFWSSAPR